MPYRSVEVGCLRQRLGLWPPVKPKAWVLGRGGPCPGKLIQQKALNGPALLQGNEHLYRVALVHREIGGVLTL